MTRNEIIKSKTSNSSILLESEQFVNLRHSKLRSPVKIMWAHGKHELRILKIENEDYMVDLEKKSTLILNPSNERHERLFKIEIDEVNQKVSLLELHDMSHYKTILKIIDRQ